MAKDCLVTTLKSNVNNDNLPLYDRICINVNSTGTTDALRFFGGVKLEIIGDGYFISADPGEGHWSDGTNSTGKTFTSTGGWKDVLVSAGNYKMYIIGKYNSPVDVISFKTYAYVNINDFNYIISGMLQLTGINNKIYGNLPELLRHTTQD